jgi:hypothetical protein
VSPPVVVFVVVAGLAVWLIVRTMQRTERMYRDDDLDDDRNERLLREVAEKQARPVDDRWGSGWGLGRSKARRQRPPP